MGIVKAMPNRPTRRTNPPINQPEVVSPINITNAAAVGSVPTQ